MIFAQEFARGDEEAAGAAGRIADRIPRRRLGQFDHQFDDVARGAELAVLPCAGDFAEHIFIDVALGVAIVHLHRIELVDHLGEQRRRRDGVARLLHVPADVAPARDLCRAGKGRRARRQP